MPGAQAQVTLEARFDAVQTVPETDLTPALGATVNIAVRLRLAGTSSHLKTLKRSFARVLGQILSSQCSYETDLTYWLPAAATADETG